MAGATTLEAFAGIGAVVLTILALSNVYPMTFTAIAAILVGVGMAFEFIGGIGGVLLGILSLVGVDPAMLLPIAALVFGGVLALGTGDSVQLASLKSNADDDKRDAINNAIRASAGAQLLVGLGSIALGIIALTVTGSDKMLLSTIAILAVAAIEFTRGSAITTKMRRMYRFFRSGD